MRTMLRLLGLASGTMFAGWACGTAVFINEIHYDNTGTDSGEAIEIAGPAGTNLTGWSIVRYNGANGLVYTTPGPIGTETLSGLIPNQQNGFGTVVVSYNSNGLQNGSPDGIALVDNGNNVVQFLSYEGSFVAADGPAIGMTSADIGVSENGTGATGDSLRLAGTGNQYEHFGWQPESSSTFGAANTGQTFLSSFTGLVINEIDYDQAGTDTAEFVELFNRGTTTVDLSAYIVELVNGNAGDATLYDTLPLPSVLLGPGGYFVICANSATVVNCDFDVTPDTNFLQNGSPDAVGLRLATGALVDALSYEGSSGAPYTEGSGTGLTDDPALVFYGISRFPNGVDANVNNVDFSERCITPGYANTSTASDCPEPRVVARVPEPATVALLGLGLAGLGLASLATRRRRGA